MIIFETNIADSLVSFFNKNLLGINSIEKANKLLKKTCGIVHFFNTSEELAECKNKVKSNISKVEELDRRAYGDFQTNQNLTKNIVKYLVGKKISPQFILEPTCGKGSFIIAALKCMDGLKKIVGIEIYYPYVWKTKFEILTLHLEKKALCKPEIEIIHADVFEFDFVKLAKENKKKEILVIGNPPWVTNSELGALNSKNLPRKSNFKKHKGIDAITGKGNFDIGEYISLLMLKYFDKHDGHFAFLVKSSVVKNIVFDQKKEQFHIGNICKLNIDAKKEFNVSVDASLFLAKFNETPKYNCQEIDFYSLEEKTKFGWYQEKFVYSISDYKQGGYIDGKSQFVWRQGVKHDCSKIMELERKNGHFINGFKKEINLEPDLVYRLLKSSDLKHETVDTYRKNIIMTQKKVGQDTSYIKRDYPQVFEYLKNHRAYFDKRKSTIYKGKPPYSIFGVGDYSFAKYKIAISGMYKRTIFSLVLPENEKPIMLDDTCYFIGFDNLIDAKIAQSLLNSKVVQDFMKSIIFPNSKRSITKDILMRIDLGKVFNLLDKSKLTNKIKNVQKSDWDSFEKQLNQNSSQMTLF